MEEYQERRGGGYMTQKTVQNPHASAPLVIPIAVLRNTTRARLDQNVGANSARDVPWVTLGDVQEGEIVLVGGGPSAADHIERIRYLQNTGSIVWAFNGASRWLREHGITPDAQIMVDARVDSRHLLDPEAKRHILASQVDPWLFDHARDPLLFHIGFDGIDALMPQEKINNVPLLGGGASVGMTAMCLAHVMGYRTLHCYGYDSSHAGRASHAYPQPMNDKIPTVETLWGDTIYTSSVAMKAQAEWFMMLSRQLRDAGCAVYVHGGGLLPAMYNAAPADLSERDKYRLMWQFDLYRASAPGEACVGQFLEIAQPNGMVIDFGCGTGRAGLAIAAAGLPVLMTDFASNCRDQDAHALPFIDWDLTDTCPVGLSAPYGFCTDVMEHIPDAEAALDNMFAVAERIYFQIDTEEDACGELIGHDLHVNLKPHAEWRALLSRYGRIAFEQENGRSSVFYVEKAT